MADDLSIIFILLHILNDLLTLTMSSTFMMFRCVFTIFNFLFFVSLAHPIFNSLAHRCRLGVELRHRDDQLVATCQISGLSFALQQPMVSSSDDSNRLR